MHRRFFENKGKLKHGGKSGIGVKSVKSCKKCGYTLDENALFCGNCGERVVLEKEKDGYFKKLFSYNSLEEEEKRKVKKKSLIIIIAFIVLIALIVFLVKGCNGSENGINNVHQHESVAEQVQSEYAYISYSDFVRLWNTAVNDENNFTDGFLIDEDINYNFQINLSGNRVLKCEAKYGDWSLYFSAEDNINECLEDLLKITISDISENAIAYWTEQLKLTSEDEGFVIEFKSTEYSVKPLERYYTEKRVITDSYTGYSTTDLTLFEFQGNLKQQYIKYVEKYTGTNLDAESKAKLGVTVEDMFRNPVRIVSDLWYSQIEEYTIDFSSGGLYETVGINIDVTEETGHIVKAWVYCADNSLLTDFNDFCDMVSASMLDISGMAEISEDLVYSQDSGTYYCVLDGLKVELTVQGSYNLLEIYPYEAADYPIFEIISDSENEGNTETDEIVISLAEAVTPNGIDKVISKMEKSLVMDWYSLVDKELNEFIGVSGNTMVYTLFDPAYDVCLYCYNFETEENKLIAKYFKTDMEYRLADDYVLFYASTDEHGAAVDLMAYNIPQDKLTVSPMKRIGDYEYEQISLDILLDNKLYYLNYNEVMCFDTQNNEYEMLADISHEFTDTDRRVMNNVVTYDIFNKDCIYYSDNEAVFNNNNGETTNTVRLYEYNIKTAETRTVVNMTYTAPYNDDLKEIAVVNGNVFLQYSSNDIYQVVDNQEIKKYTSAPVEISLKNRLDEDTYMGGGVAYYNDIYNVIIVIDGAGEIAVPNINNFSTVELTDIFNGDMLMNGSLELNNFPDLVSGYWFCDYYNDNGSGVVLWYIPCKGTYIDSKAETLSDGTIVTKFYFFMNSNDIEKMIFQNEKTKQLKPGIYEITGNDLIIVDSLTNN